MDVQTLAIRNGFPDRRQTRAKPQAPPRSAPADSGGGDAASIARRRPWLLVYTSVSIIAGLTALAWTTLRVPISPAIDPNLDGTALAGPSAFDAYEHIVASPRIHTRGPVGVDSALRADSAST